MYLAAQHYVLYVLYGLIYFCFLELTWAERSGLSSSTLVLLLFCVNILFIQQVFIACFPCTSNGSQVWGHKFEYDPQGPWSHGSDILVRGRQTLHKKETR